MDTYRPAMLPQQNMPWLSFAPRQHTIRRTATGVLSGYFEPRLRGRGALIPLANTNTVPFSMIPLADGEAIPRDSRGQRRRRREGKSRREREKEPGLKSKHHPSRTVSFSADPTPIIAPLTPATSHSSSTTPIYSLSAAKSSPLLLPADTTVEKSSAARHTLIPVQSTSDRNSHKKRKRPAKPVQKRQNPDTLDNSIDCPSLETDDEEEDIRATKSRRRSGDNSRRKSPDGKPPPAKKQPPSKKGWKGWIELESSPEPNERLIKLDEPILLERKTRSGKYFDGMISYPDSPRSQSSGYV